MKKTISCFGLIALMLIMAGCSNLHAQTPVYKVTGKIILGPASGWDYCAVEETTGRLFVSYQNKVTVVNINDNTIIGEIGEQTGVHGIDFAPEFNKGFISNRDGAITIFNLTTLKKIKTVKVDGKNPDAICYDPFSKRVFAFNHSSNNVTAIDADKETIVGTIALEGVPEFAVTDNNGKMFVNLEDKSKITEFDPMTLKVIVSWPIAPAESPSGLAIDRENKRLFAVGDNKLMAIVDYTTGKVVAKPAIGDGPDACAYDPGTKLVFSSNGQGTLTVIEQTSPNKYKVLSTIPTQNRARTMAVDLKTHKVFLPYSFDGDPKPGETAKTKTFALLVLEYVK